LFESHVINETNRVSSICGEFVLWLKVLLHEVPGQIEDGAVEDQEVLRMARSRWPGQMRFETRAAKEKNILGFADELAGGQIVISFLWMEG